MRAVERFVTEASPDTVWKILADVEHWCDWTPTVLEIKPVTDGGLRTGARYRVIQPKLRPGVFEVTECAAHQAFTWVQRFPGGEMIADHRITARNGRTEVELSFGTNGLLANVIGVLFAKTIREYLATETNSLKQECETRSRNS